MPESSRHVFRFLPEMFIFDFLRFLFLYLVLAGFILPAQNIDLRMLKSMNRGDHLCWDKTMRGTSFSIYPVMAAGTGGLLLTGYLQHDKVMMRNSGRMLASIVVDELFTTGLKYSFKRKRPFDAYPNDIVKRTSVGGYSFPSGHTSGAFATATALTMSTKKWYVAVPAYIYACGVGYSRMRLGAHYPSDVLGGAVVGIGSTLLVWRVDKWILGHHKK